MYEVEKCYVAVRSSAIFKMANSSEIMKPKPLVTRLHAFRLSETCECCCYTGLPVSFVIGQSYYSVLGIGL